MDRRHWMLGFTASALLGLSACSSTYVVSADVSSFGHWPESRKPASYAFDRLPSQQQEGERQAALERAAAAALAKAGFRPAPDAKSADVLVSIGMSVNANDRAPWDDPLWWRWHGSYGGWRYGHYWRGGLGPMWTEPRYERGVALLLRDRSSGEPLYEARASNEGMTMGDARLPGALFDAAMSDFPKAEPKPHRVGVQVSREAP
ncbi:DUF4136 domain-containing protein [Roseateles sp. DB2]|uniref:DUF4136 domain-containing protein n=1 Tax=Roseateles sp. DB2 TaxID=3453717 RepID=UPI003EEB1964